jgi:hypothetical protein
MLQLTSRRVCWPRGGVGGARDGRAEEVVALVKRMVSQPSGAGGGAREEDAWLPRREGRGTHEVEINAPAERRRRRSR